MPAFTGLCLASPVARVATIFSNERMLCRYVLLSDDSLFSSRSIAICAFLVVENQPHH